MVPVRTYAPRSSEHRKLEEDVEKCFELFNDGIRQAIRVGLMAQDGKNFFMDFNRYVDGVPGNPTPPSDGSATKYRIFIDVKAIVEHQIDNTLVTGFFVTDNDFKEDGGVVLSKDEIAIILHLCPRGMFLHFDPRRSPDSCLSVRLGNSITRHNTEAFGPPPSEERLQFERYVRRCISYAKDGHVEAITLGVGAWENFKYFLDFVMPQYHPDGTTPQAYRIFLDVTRSEEHQLKFVEELSHSNDDFVSVQNGKIFGPRAAKIRLHACPIEVSIHFDPVLPPYVPIEYHIGPSSPRVNQFSEYF